MAASSESVASDDEDRNMTNARLEIRFSASKSSQLRCTRSIEEDNFIDRVSGGREGEREIGATSF